MPRIADQDVETLKGHLDMLDVVSDYVQLKRSGAKYKGLCPFHEEKTPSFTVDPSQGLYYCFGCQEGGDVYSFVENVSGMSFREAVESLARRAKFELTYEEMTDEQRHAMGRRSRLVTIHEHAAQFFQRRLLGEEGKVARDYLKSRGFGKEDAETFQLGFSTLEMHQLYNALKSGGHDDEDLLASGLFYRHNSGKVIDRFRGRLMFPIHSPQGDIIAFAGRVLPNIDYWPEDPPKYLNSPETPLYRKTEVLYGLSHGRSEVQRTNQVLLVEGYTDVLAMHKLGATMTVATCGTAVTRDHMRILSRMASQVTLVFDPDAAGIKAAERGWEAADGFELRVNVVGMPEGLDPADWAEKVGEAGVRDAIDAAIPVERFMLRKTVERYDVTDTYQRADALTECISVLQRVDDPTVRLGLAERDVANLLDLPPARVIEEARHAGVSMSRHVPLNTSGRNVNVQVDVAQARAKLERDVLWFVLNRPDLLPEEWWAGEVIGEDFEDQVVQRVFYAVQETGGAGVDPTFVRQSVADDGEATQVLQSALLADGPLSPTESLAADYLARLMEPRAVGEQQRALEALEAGDEGAADWYRAASQRLKNIRNRPDG